MGLFTKSKMDKEMDMKDVNSSFEFVIRDCFTVGENCVVVGSVKKGRVDPGDVLVLSNGDTCSVKSIEGARKSLHFATAGDGSVGIFLDGVETSLMRKEKRLYKA